MVGCSSKALGLNAHVLHQLKDADISPEVAGAKETQSSGLVLVLDDGENLAVVSRANDDLAAKRGVFKSRVDIDIKSRRATSRHSTLERLSIENSSMRMRWGTQEEFANGLPKGMA